MNFENLTPRTIVFIGVGLLILAIVVTFGYGLFWVWYQATGFEEVNMPSFKPQEKPGAVSLPSASVMTERKEPKLASRAEALIFNNPIPPTADSLKAGKQLYLTVCAPCHGREGEGQGVMGTVPNLAPLPPEEAVDLATYLGGFSQLPSPQLNLNWVKSLPDGDIFYTITNGGYAIMPSFKDTLTPEERWHLINYIKYGLGPE